MLYLHVFPGSPTLEAARADLWRVRAEWFNLGYALLLPMETLEVIQIKAYSSYSTLYTLYPV